MRFPPAVVGRSLDQREPRTFLAGSSRITRGRFKDALEQYWEVKHEEAVGANDHRPH